jgi:cytochrome P450
MSPIIFIIVAAFMLVMYIIRKIPLFLKLRKIPTAPGFHPFVGHLFTLYSIQKKYGIESGAALHQFASDVLADDYYHDMGIFKIWLGPIPIVVLTSPDTVQVILRKGAHAVPKSFIYKILDIGLKGLVNNNGLKWKNHRKLLTPAFDFRILENVLPIVNRSSKELVSDLVAVSEKDNGVVEDLSLITSYYAFKILYESAIGFEFEESRFNRVDEVLAEVEELLTKRALSPWLMNDFIFGLTKPGKRALHLLNDILHPFSLECYADRLKYRREHRIHDKEDTHDNSHDDNDLNEVIEAKVSFLDILIDENHRDSKNFTEEDIFGELKTFLVAGFDTTANTITWFLQNIGSYPEIQKRIQDELHDIFSDDPSRETTMEDLKQMRYLEACIKESMRFTSTTPYTVRDCAEDVEVSSRSLVIPKDATVLLYHYFVHKDRKHWKDPFTFNPDRFFESTEKRNPFAFIPFSAGPRNCPGQKYASLEQKGLLSSILRNFTVISLQPTSSIQIEPAVTMKPKQKLRMRFIRRHP